MYITVIKKPIGTKKVTKVGDVISQSVYCHNMGLKLKCEYIMEELIIKEGDKIAVIDGGKFSDPYQDSDETNAKIRGGIVQKIFEPSEFTDIVAKYSEICDTVNSMPTENEIWAELEKMITFEEFYENLIKSTDVEVQVQL